MNEKAFEALRNTVYDIQSKLLDIFVADQVASARLVRRIAEPVNVIYHDPATIVFWDDGTKTVVKAHDGDEYNPIMGFLLCHLKKMYGNRSKYNELLKLWAPIDIPEKPKKTVEKEEEKTEPAVKSISEDVIPDLEVVTVKQLDPSDWPKIDIAKPVTLSEPCFEDFKKAVDQYYATFDKETDNAPKQATVGYTKHKNPAHPKLEEYCKEHNLSYKAMDEMLGWKEGHFSELMNKPTDKIRKSQIDAILFVTGLTYNELFN